ncbi:MAG: hypothetical protein ACP5GO_05100 [Thermoprotei archaeon]
MSNNGNLLLGIVIGFLAAIAIGWVPFFGLATAGFLAGIIAKGPKRGLLAGLGASTLGLIIITLMLTIWGALIGGFMGAVTFGLIGMGISFFLALLWAGGILLAAIAGVVGGIVGQEL